MELPDETVGLLEEAAEIAGSTVSDVIARGAEREARVIVGGAAIEEQLEEMGEISEQAREWAEEVHQRHLKRDLAHYQAKAS
ncbi:hypothetical protein [Spirillospora sp. CA-294931]|uniref:hypothetical protein n=1 Tax=Spirillospora sp. CA-294931 TaxID=3240042 RepID=UPI003D90A5FE